MECIKNNSKELANRIESMLKNPIIYTENNGIFILKNSKFNNNILEYNEILSTIKNNFYNLLNQNNKIEIINKNKIKINHNILDDVGFMLFS